MTTISSSSEITAPGSSRRRLTKDPPPIAHLPELARAIEERRIGSEPLGDGTVQGDAALLGLRMRGHAEEFSTRFSAPERSGSA
jgi:hypothetical protein